MKITARQLRALIRETIMNEEEAAATSKLMIKIMPATGATAQLDGDSVETETSLDVGPGEHTVKLMQGGKSATFKFTAMGGKTHRLVWDFATNSHPVGGDIYAKDFTKIETPVSERRRR
jgi:hypothetical protein